MSSMKDGSNFMFRLKKSKEDEDLIKLDSSGDRVVKEEKDEKPKSIFDIMGSLSEDDYKELEEEDRKEKEEEAEYKLKQYKKKKRSESEDRSAKEDNEGSALGSQDYPPEEGLSRQGADPGKGEVKYPTHLRQDAGGGEQLPFTDKELDERENMPVERLAGATPDMYGPSHGNNHDQRGKHVLPPGEAKPMMDTLIEEMREKEKEKKKKEKTEEEEEADLSLDEPEVKDDDEGDDLGDPEDYVSGNVSPDSSLPVPAGLDEAGWNSLSHEEQVEYHGLLGQMHTAIDSHNFVKLTKVVGRVNSLQGKMRKVTDALNVPLPEPPPEEPSPEEGGPEGSPPEEVPPEMGKSLGELGDLFKASYSGPAHIGRPQAGVGRPDVGVQRAHVNPEVNKQQGGTARGLPIGTIHFWNIKGEKVPFKKVGPGEWEEVKDHKPPGHGIEEKGDDRLAVHGDKGSVEFHKNALAKEGMLDKIKNEEGTGFDLDKLYDAILDHYEEESGTSDDIGSLDEHGRFLTKQYIDGEWKYSLSDEKPEATGDKDLFLSGKDLMSNLYVKHRKGVFKESENISSHINSVEIPDELWNDPDLMEKAEIAGRRPRDKKGSGDILLGLYRLSMDHILKNGKDHRLLADAEKEGVPDLNKLMWTEPDVAGGGDFIFVQGMGARKNGTFENEDLYRIRVEDLDELVKETKGDILGWAQEKITADLAKGHKEKREFKRLEDDPNGEFSKVHFKDYFKKRDEDLEARVEYTIGGHSLSVRYNPGTGVGIKQVPYTVKCSDVNDYAANRFLADLVPFARTGDSKVDSKGIAKIQFETDEALLRFLNVAHSFGDLVDGKSSKVFSRVEAELPELRYKDPKFNPEEFAKAFPMTNKIETGQIPYKLEVSKFINPDFSYLNNKNGELNLNDPVGVTYLSNLIGVSGEVISGLVAQWNGLTDKEKDSKDLFSHLESSLGISGLKTVDGKLNLVFKTPSSIEAEQNRQRLEEAGIDDKKGSEIRKELGIIGRQMSLLPDLSAREQLQLHTELTPIALNALKRINRTLPEKDKLRNRSDAEKDGVVDEFAYYLPFMVNEAVKHLTVRMGGGRGGGFMPFGKGSQSFKDDRDHKYRNNLFGFIKSQWVDKQGNAKRGSDIYKSIISDKNPFVEELHHDDNGVASSSLVKKNIMIPVYVEDQEKYVLPLWKKANLGYIDGMASSSGVDQDQHGAIMANAKAQMDKVTNIQEAKEFAKGAMQNFGLHIQRPIRKTSLAQMEAMIEDHYANARLNSDTPYDQLDKEEHEAIERINGRMEEIKEEMGVNTKIELKEDAIKQVDNPDDLKSSIIDAMDLRSLEDPMHKDFLSKMPKIFVENDEHGLGASLFNSYVEHLQTSGSKGAMDRFFSGEMNKEDGKKFNDFVNSKYENMDREERAIIESGFSSYFKNVQSGLNEYDVFLNDFAEELLDHDSHDSLESVLSAMKDNYKKELSYQNGIPLIGDLFRHLSGDLGQQIFNKVRGISVDNKALKSISRLLQDPRMEIYKSHPIYRSVMNSMLRFKRSELFDKLSLKMDPSNGSKRSVLKSLLRMCEDETSITSDHILEISKSHGVKYDDVLNWAKELKQDDLFKSIVWYAAADSIGVRSELYKQYASNLAVKSFEDGIE